MFEHPHTAPHTLRWFQGEHQPQQKKRISPVIPPPRQTLGEPRASFTQHRALILHPSPAPALWAGSPQGLRAAGKPSAVKSLSPHWPRGPGQLPSPTEGGNSVEASEESTEQRVKSHLCSTTEAQIISSTSSSALKCQSQGKSRHCHPTLLCS